MLCIQHLNTGYIANCVTYYFWKETPACITVLLWTDLGVLSALLIMFLLLLFPDGSVDLTMQTVPGWVWLGWTQLMVLMLVVWKVCHLRAITFCFLPNAFHSPAVFQCFSAIMPEFILCPAGAKIKLSLWWKSWNFDVSLLIFLSILHFLCSHCWSILTPFIY